MNLREMMMRAPDGVDGGGGGGDAASAPAGDTNGAGSPASDDFSGFDFGGSDDLDSVTIGGGPEVAPQPAPPASAPAVAATPAPPPQVATPAPAATTTQPTARAPAAQTGPISVDQMGKLFEQNREGMLNQLASNLFTLTAEEVDGLQVTPEKVLPQLLARTLFAALSAIPHQLQQFVPAMIAKERETSTKQTAAANEFYGVWPQMPRQHDGAVARALRAYKQMNPQASRADVIRVGGHMACLALGLDPSQVAQAASNEATSRTNGARAGGFVPAGSAAAIPSVARTDSLDEGDPWAGFDLPNAGN